MKLKDATGALVSLLKEAGVKVTYDPDASYQQPCFICGTSDGHRKLVVVGTWSRFVGTRGDKGTPIRRPLCAACEAEPAKTSLVRSLAEKDPDYCPYCLKCRGLVRMQLVEPFYWECGCGAVHDERRPGVGVSTE